MVVVECCDCVVACFLVAGFVWFVLVYSSLFCGCVDDLVLFGYLCFGSMLQGGVLFWVVGCFCLWCGCLIVVCGLGVVILWFVVGCLVVFVVAPWLMV